jgi:hypothetical protein
MFLTLGGLASLVEDNGGFESVPDWQICRTKEGFRESIPSFVSLLQQHT